MSQPELVSKAVRLLAQLGRGGMLTGSLASSFHGEPRSTHDVDFVVELQISDLPALLAAFPAPRYYVSEAAAREAIQQRGMFNVVNLDSGDKIDFWLLTNQPFDRSRFARRGLEKLFGMDVPITSPEDTILAKLVWEKESGGSEKQRQDVLSVLEIQFAKLDFAYLDSWAKTLGVEDQWRTLKQAADPLA